MSPVSKVRHKGKPAGVQVSSAVKREQAHREYRRRERLRKIGFVLITLGIGLALEHVAAHLGAFGGAQPSPLVDLTLGWPLAGVIVVIGMILAGQRRY